MNVLPSHDDTPLATHVTQPGTQPVSLPTRRVVLSGTGAGAMALLLAACGGGAPSGTQDGQGSGDGSDGGGDGSQLVGPGQVLAGADDVPVGGALAVTVDGEQLLVTQPEEGTFAAFSAICTHQGCTVAPGDGELVCPCHASRYDLATGAVLGGPAPSPLPEVPVTVDGGEVTST
ncbi:Rieske (2Fe-2S) protein [Cellulosimicrobium protaetiae]|uniref:Cytochrome bc1 complex Rieske iron-sulfur subunit n=1 Tax=Cellulosimicrobium protaetiae TaxID=2587808 RepID=A0A6M5UEJ8_9MICO|nr:Rieske (2Fe-2S) protein [Cellulosimicrobium protaetiae]QJW37007.1 Rieske (2Fe-2S) protein [Cellulosimicrobium protaetiae]